MARISRRRLIGGAAALGGLAVIEACAPGQSAPSPAASAPAGSATPTATPKPIAVKAAWVALTANQMLWPVAVEAGYFKKYGIDFDLNYIAGSNNAVASMTSGEIGLTSVAGSAVVTAQAGGTDIVMVAGFVNKMIFRIMALPKYKSISEVKDATIAVTRVGTADYFAWQSIAKRQGWDFTKLKFISANDSQGQVAVLKSGNADVIALSPPNNILAEMAGAVEILDMASYNEPEQNVGIAVTRKYLTENRPAVVGVMKASIEAIARWKKDPAFVKDVEKKYLKVDDQKFLDVGYDAYKDIFQQAPYPSEEALAKVIEETSVVTPKAKDLDVKKLIDRSVIQELETSGFIKLIFP